MVEFSILVRDRAASVTSRASGMRWGKIAAFTLMLAVAACGPSQAEIDAKKAKEAAAQAAQRQALAKAADDRKRAACEGAIQVAQSFFGHARDIQSDVEAAHSVAVEKARISKENFSSMVASWGGCQTSACADALDDDSDKYRNAQKQSLVEQQAALESFTPLEEALKDYSQASQVASAGGVAFGTAEICKHAQALIGQSNEALSRLGRSTKSVTQDIENHRQVIEAAEKRLSAALAG